MRYFLLILMTCLFFPSLLSASSTQSLYAQLPINPVFSRLGVEEGLSQGTVYAIAQDKRGYLWFGTESGLNRYDSQEVHVFTTLNSGLTDNHITALAVDQFGSLWIGTEKGGLHILSANSQEIVSVPLPHINPAMASGINITTIISDIYGTIWIAIAQSGLFRCEPLPDPKKESIIPIGLNIPNNLQKTMQLHLTSLHFDPSGTLWIGTRQHGLFRIYPHHYPQNEYTPEAVALNETTQADPHLEILDLQSDLNGGLWIATGQGLFSYNPQTHLAKRRWKDSIELIIRDLYLDHRGSLWMATDGAGVALIQPENTTQPVSFFTHIPSLSSSLSANGTEVIFEDCFGVLWIGTFRAGLNRLALNGNDPKTRHRPPFISLPETITLNISGFFSNAGINAIVEDPGSAVWLGTETEGIVRLTKPQERSSLPLVSQIKLPPKKGISSPTVVTALTLTRDRTMWIGTYTDGLYHFPLTSASPDPNSLVHIPADMSRTNVAPPHPFISSLLCSDKGDLWIGTIGGGLSCIRHNSTIFEHAPLDSESDTTLSDRSILSLFYDQSDRLWIGTAYGLNLLSDTARNLTNSTITPLRTQPDFFPPLQEQPISSIFQDNQGKMWIGTQNNGLFKIDKLSKNKVEVTQYTTRDGLSGNLIASITEDIRGHLWISTNNGISSFDPAQKHFISFKKAQGLPVNEFFKGAMCNLSGGDLVFGSQRGAILFNPLSLSLDPNPPMLTFDQLRYTDTDKGPQSLSIRTNETVRLSQKEFPISIHFSAIHTVSTEQFKRLYQLKNVDSTWQEDNGSQTATYSSLPSGTYHFLLKAANQDNLWTTTPIKLTLVISPPFLKSFPFIAIVVILLTLILTFLHFWRLGKAVNKVKQKYEKTLLSTEQKDQVVKIITDYANQTSCFTDPEMTLSKFSNLAGLPAHNVSQAINSDLGVSFPDFINELRISYAQRQIDESINDGQTIKFSDLYITVGFSSQAAFNRVFKKILSATPSDYCITKKMTKAKQVLSDENNSDMSLTEIAVKCGFNTEAAFSRIFKSKESISPAQYRKQKQNVKNNKQK